MQKVFLLIVILKLFCPLLAEARDNTSGNQEHHPPNWINTLPAPASTENWKDGHNATIRGDVEEKNIYLIFSADLHADGTKHILKTLNKKNVKASFFLTGRFIRNKKLSRFTRSMVRNNHYVGAHSDQHLLYNTWENRDSLLVNHTQFVSDLQANYRELKKLGVTKADAPYFLPPYEWYNSTIVEWCKELNIEVINFTPGIGTNADYTTPSMHNYASSDMLLDRLYRYEQTNDYGLNGAIVLIHLGTHPDRTDKFYLKLEEIILSLTKRGYSFKKINHL